MNLTALSLFALLSTGAAQQEAHTEAPQAVRVAAVRGNPVDLEQLRAHYAAAEAELRANPSEDMTEAQRARRGVLLDALAAYRERGDFGVADDPSRSRALRFVDAEGRRCAVAELLHVDGRDDLVDLIAGQNNEAYLAEIAETEALANWLEDVGLTLAEVARIQGPARGAAWRGGARTGAVVAGGAVTGGALASPMGSSVGTGMQELLGADWWSWWEFSKVGFLGTEPVVQELELDLDDNRTRANSRRESVVRRTLPAIADRLEDQNATVRAAAAVTYGRIAGAAAIPKLRALLDDASLEVREAALLGLGATGAEEAAHLLLSIAHERKVKGLDSWRETKEIAVLALALLRDRGAGLGVDGMLPRAEGRQHEAAFLHAALTPSPRLLSLAREESALFQGSRRPHYDRRGDFADVLAIEALREDPGEDVLAALLRASGERDMERRRSAITTLGALGDERADGPLRTAFETESDSVGRGLALIAIAKSGAEDAGQYLARVLERGRSLDRPWAAIGLGLLARDQEQTEARSALREALGKERNRDNRRAVALALGIARDQRSIPELVQRIQAAKDAGSRVAYGYALGMIGDPAAAPVLRAALELEHLSLPRAELAQALGALRIDSDLPDLVESLRKANDADAAVQSAAALSFHGSVQAVPLLIQAMEEAKSPNAEAAALLAIGLVLDEGKPFVIAGELSDRNPFVAPAWFLRATQTTL